jgi:hypothetical protein
MIWLRSYLFCGKYSISRTTEGWKVAETWMLGVLVIQLWHLACCKTLYRSHTLRCRYILQEWDRMFIYSQHSHSVLCRVAARRVVSYMCIIWVLLDNMLKIHFPKFMHSFFFYIFVCLVMNDTRYCFGRKNGKVKVYIFNCNAAETVESSKLNTGNI